MKQQHTINHRKWYDCRADKTTVWLSNQRDDWAMHNGILRAVVSTVFQYNVGLLPLQQCLMLLGPLILSWSVFQAPPKKHQVQLMSVPADRIICASCRYIMQGVTENLIWFDEMWWKFKNQSKTRWGTLAQIFNLRIEPLDLFYSLTHYYPHWTGLHDFSSFMFDIPLWLSDQS